MSQQPSPSSQAKDSDGQIKGSIINAKAIIIAAIITAIVGPIIVIIVNLIIAKVTTNVSPSFSVTPTIASAFSVTPNSSATSPSHPPASVRLPQGQAAFVGGIWKISIGGVVLGVSSDNSIKQAAIFVNMTNVSRLNQSEDPSKWSLTDPNGKTYQQTPYAAFVPSPDYARLSSGIVSPDNVASGWIFFDIPKSGEYILVFADGALVASWDISVS